MNPSTSAGTNTLGNLDSRRRDGERRSQGDGQRDLLVLVVEPLPRRTNSSAAAVPPRSVKAATQHGGAVAGGVERPLQGLDVGSLAVDDHLAGQVGELVGRCGLGWRQRRRPGPQRDGATAERGEPGQQGIAADDPIDQRHPRLFEVGHRGPGHDHRPGRRRVVALDVPQRIDGGRGELAGRSTGGVVGQVRAHVTAPARRGAPPPRRRRWCRPGAPAPRLARAAPRRHRRRAGGRGRTSPRHSPPPGLDHVSGAAHPSRSASGTVPSRLASRWSSPARRRSSSACGSLGTVDLLA